MPLSANQLAALVERAWTKAPPVIAAPPPPAVPRPKAIAQPSPAKPPPAEPPPASASPDDFLTGGCLERNSWHFHRRFYAIFRRPMHRGEYSHLLWQIRRGTAEHLWEDCWRVSLPGHGDRTLPVRATRRRLITILPKHWQPPVLQQ
jgi:hypothetical protein